MSLSPAEIKPVRIATYQQEKSWVSLWKSTPENRFQGGKTIYWLECHDPMRSGWQTERISQEAALQIYLQKGWTRTRVYAAQHLSIQSRQGLQEIEPNVFAEVC